MEHDIPFGNSNRENGTTFLDFPLFLGIFQWDEPTKRVPFTAEPEIPEILTKWKAPKTLLHGFKRSWFVICGFRSVLCVSLFQGSLLVIVIMIDGSDKHNCEGGF